MSKFLPLEGLGTKVMLLLMELYRRSWGYIEPDIWRFGAISLNMSSYSAEDGEDDIVSSPVVCHIGSFLFV